MITFEVFWSCDLTKWPLFLGSLYLHPIFASHSAFPQRELHHILPDLLSSWATIISPERCSPHHTESFAHCQRASSRREFGVLLFFPSEDCRSWRLPQIPFDLLESQAPNGDYHLPLQTHPPVHPYPSLSLPASQTWVRRCQVILLTLPVRILPHFKCYLLPAGESDPSLPVPSNKHSPDVRAVFLYIHTVLDTFHKMPLLAWL